MVAQNRRGVCGVAHFHELPHGTNDQYGGLLLADMDAIALIINPLSEPSVEKFAGLIDHSSTQEDQPCIPALEEIVRTLERQYGTTLAVFEIDLLVVINHAEHTRLQQAFTKCNLDCMRSSHVREFLVKAGLGSFSKFATRRFRRVVFAVYRESQACGGNDAHRLLSAVFAKLGVNKSSVNLIGIAENLAWWFERSKRGLAGSRNQRIAWTLSSIAITGILWSGWYLVGFGGLAFAAFLILSGFLGGFWESILIRRARF